MVNRTVMMDMNTSEIVPDYNSLIDLNLSNLAMTDYNMITDGTMVPITMNTKNMSR